MVTTVAPVDLPLHLPGLLVVRAGRVGKDGLASLSVEEILSDSSLVEPSLLVEQGIFEVLSLAEVLLDSIFVVFVVLVCQSLLVVALGLQVNLGLLTVLDAFRSLVIRTLLVCECFLQVTRLAEVLVDGELVQFAVLVSERLLVDFRVFQFLGGAGLGADHGSLVRRQVSELLGIQLGGLGGLALEFSGEFSGDGSLGSLGSGGSGGGGWGLGGLGSQGSLGSGWRLGHESRLFKKKKKIG